jgi:hypothetical protein
MSLEVPATDSPRVRRRWPKPPWYVRLSRWLYFKPGIWWTGEGSGIGPEGGGSRHCVMVSTGRQAAWQVLRLPLGLLLFLYAVCCVISGRAVSLAVFRAFVAQVFNSKGGL